MPCVRAAQRSPVLLQAPQVPARRLPASSRNCTTHSDEMNLTFADNYCFKITCPITLVWAQEAACESVRVWASLHERIKTHNAWTR
jgi:hypothetical protein